MKVFVTNAAGSFGAALLPALCGSAGIEAVTGTDARPQRFQHAKFRAAELDLQDPRLTSLLEHHDALVHLGSCDKAVNGSSADAVEASVRPAHKLFQTARAAGIRRLVHLSSAAVYGPVVHANEQSPLRPLAGFPYAQQQAHLERLLAIDCPECVRLRPHVVVGPHAHPAVRSLLRLPLYPRGSEPQPLFQCVHEDDLARAVLLSLESGARGAYNIATEDSFTLGEATRARRGFSFAISNDTAHSVLRLARRYLRSELEPVWIERAAHTVLVNCRRAIAELGWRSRYTAREALAAT